MKDRNFFTLPMKEKKRIINIAAEASNKAQRELIEKAIKKKTINQIQKIIENNYMNKTELFIAEQIGCNTNAVLHGIYNILESMKI